MRFGNVFRQWLKKVYFHIFYQPSSFLKNNVFAGGIQSPVAVRGWMVECTGSLHVLQIMWMAHPNQADRPQGTHRVSVGILVANDLGIGSGWQQSKQNWARPAVVGHWARMKCRNLCCVQDVQLHPFARCRALAITSFQSGMLLEVLEVSYFSYLTIVRLITSRSLRDPPLSHGQGSAL